MAKKNRLIIVQGENITITKDDYISLTDMLKAKDGDFFISDWLRNRNTVEYLGGKAHNIVYTKRLNTSFTSHVHIRLNTSFTLFSFRTYL